MLLQSLFLFTKAFESLALMALVVFFSKRREKVYMKNVKSHFLHLYVIEQPEKIRDATMG